MGWMLFVSAVYVPASIFAHGEWGPAGVAGCIAGSGVLYFILLLGTLLRSTDRKTCLTFLSSLGRITFAAGVSFVAALVLYRNLDASPVVRLPAVVGAFGITYLLALLLLRVGELPLLFRLVFHKKK